MTAANTFIRIVYTFQPLEGQSICCSCAGGMGLDPTCPVHGPRCQLGRIQVAISETPEWVRRVRWVPRSCFGLIPVGPADRSVFRRDRGLPLSRLMSARIRAVFRDAGGPRGPVQPSSPQKAYCPADTLARDEGRLDAVKANARC
jgi:hypothetical protein